MSGNSVSLIPLFLNSPSTSRDFRLIIRDLRRLVPYAILVKAQQDPSKYHVSRGFCRQASDKPNDGKNFDL